jgi:hypothetical protein
MTFEVLAAFVLALLQTLVPEAQHAWRHELPNDTHERYVALAEAVAEVSLDEPPLPGLDPMRTAYVLASVAAKESSLRADIMDCRAPGMGGARGPFQAERRNNWLRACESYSSATRLALDMLRESWVVCVHLPELERGAFYTGGMKWMTPGARRESRRRLRPALR